MTDEELFEKQIEEQVIANARIEEKQEEQVDEGPIPEVPAKKVNAASEYIGTSLRHKPGDNPFAGEDDKHFAEKKKLSRLGEKIGQNSEIRDGWIDVDRSVLGERAIYYPADWNFRIRPATVEAIRNWSTIDDENANSIDDVFNEILKSCLSIVTPAGPLPWGNIRSWDRFFFLLLIREYTFVDGETKIKYDEECIECENPVTFELTSQSLMYEYPDEEVMKYYSQEDGCWYIDPTEFDLDGDVIKLYLPTLEKDANIKAWLIARLQENRNRKIDQVFLRFLPWMAPKISKDATIAAKQIKELEMRYKSWDADMFSFLDDVLKNIIVTPSTKLISTCPVCGEEITSDIRFPNNVRSLFNIQTKFKKFGKK